MKKRDLITVAILTVITIGLYFFYWSYKTKEELKSLGADIPTAFLTIVPLANFYFWYKYSVAFAKYIRKSDDYIGYFILASCLPVISMFVLQNEYNKLGQQI